MSPQTKCWLLFALVATCCLNGFALEPDPPEHDWTVTIADRRFGVMGWPSMTVVTYGWGVFLVRMPFFAVVGLAVLLLAILVGLLLVFPRFRRRSVPDQTS